MIEEDNINELSEYYTSPIFDINQKYKFKVTPLISTLKESSFSLVEYVTLCGSVACFRFLYGNNGSNVQVTPLFAACENGHIEIVKFLLTILSFDLNKSEVNNWNNKVIIFFRRYNFLYCMRKWTYRDCKATSLFSIR